MFNDKKFISLTVLYLIAELDALTHGQFREFLIILIFYVTINFTTVRLSCKICKRIIFVIYYINDKITTLLILKATKSGVI